jgi:heme-degrading monooxygenase HmoA
MPGGDHDQAVSVIKINAITVREGSGDELARRFANRAGAVDDVDGFEGFELLRPDDGRDTWLVVTRWRDDDAFDAWVASPAFAHGHGSDRHGEGGDQTAGEQAERHSQQPVGRHSELWSYRVVDLPPPR